LGQSFARAGAAINGYRTLFINDAVALSSSRLLNAIAWRALDKRYPWAFYFNRRILKSSFGQCAILLASGLCPVVPRTLRVLKRRAVLCLYFSSDDPWNPGQAARWLYEALPEYDIVFTPRRANIPDFLALGCKEVHYVPFGFDAELFPAGGIDGSRTGPTPQVLFVGGADLDRVDFFRKFLTDQGDVSLVGGYWDRFDDLKPFWMGHLPPKDILALTTKAAVNLILVRRVNRDGHVMRTFEAGAIGGCLAVEDTGEHREIFGAEGETVRYFRTPSEAATLCRTLIAHPAERLRLATAVKTRIREGANTYADRLRTILAIAADIRRAAHRRCGAPS
jgi:spore maturation protein CgeB